MRSPGNPWIPDSRRQAIETAALLRFGTRVLTGLALAAMAAAALVIAG